MRGTSQKKVIWTFCFVLMFAVFPVLSSKAEASSDLVFNFESGVIGWQSAWGSFSATPLEFSGDLARGNNNGSLKLNVQFAGGAWEEAVPKVTVSDLSKYEAISYDIYVPADTFTGKFLVRTAINYPWKELGNWDEYDISNYGSHGYSTETIGDKTYVVVHKQDQLTVNGQQEILLKIAAKNSSYTGGIYVDNVVLHANQPVEGTVYEAENALLIGTEVSAETQGYTGTGYVTGFDQDGDQVVFTVNVESDGAYPLAIRYHSPWGDKTNILVVNGVTAGEKVFAQSSGFTDLNAGKVLLHAGENTVAIAKSWGWFYVDHIRIGGPELRPPLEPVSPDLVNPYASPETKALMNYLTDIYGKHILSGQQAGVLDELGYVHSVTGRLPAVAGFDFLDDGMLEQALQWAEYGGLVTYSWHWRAPLGGHEFYTDKTTFDVTRAVTPGTEEYELIIRDIDNIAAKLKTLSDAGVPVLWRPLHEAEGGWFWWGAKGPEAAKALYRILFDRLTNYHKLDNLIWIWTTSSSSQSVNWYPGNEYVDILGMDKYLSEGDYRQEIGYSFGDRHDSGP